MEERKRREEEEEEGEEEEGGGISKYIPSPYCTHLLEHLVLLSSTPGSSGWHTAVGHTYRDMYTTIGNCTLLSNRYNFSLDGSI